MFKLSWLLSIVTLFLLKNSLEKVQQSSIKQIFNQITWYRPFENIHTLSPQQQGKIQFYHQDQVEVYEVVEKMTEKLKQKLRKYNQFVSNVKINTF